MDWNEADTWPETPVSEELFASRYTTRELAYQLAASISAQPFGRADGDRMWEEYLANPDGTANAPFWYRGIVCRSLAHLGTTLRTINFRKS